MSALETWERALNFYGEGGDIIPDLAEDDDEDDPVIGLVGAGAVLPLAKAKAKGKAKAKTKGKAKAAAKLHRLASLDWTVAVDRQLQNCAGVGLSAWRDSTAVCSTTGVWKYADFAVDPDKYQPGLHGMLSFDMDQGSINSASFWYLLFVERIMAVSWWDPSHRWWNDVRDGISDLGCWSLILLSCATWNFTCGPWRSRAYWCQMVEMIHAMHRTLDHNFPIFQMYLADVARDWGEEEELPKDYYAKHVWDNLLAYAGLQAKGVHVSLGRWMSWLDATKDWLKFWSARLVVLLLLGLRQGFCVQVGDLTGVADLCRKDAVGDTKSGGADATVTPMAQSNVQVGKLRSATKNAAHMALVFLLEPAHKLRCRVLSVIAGPFRHQYGLERKSSKDANAAVCLHCHMAIGSGIRTCNETVLLFQDEQFCKDIGSAAPLHDFHPQEKLAAMLEGRELADFAVQFWMSLARRRLRSQLPFFRGWPHRFVVFHTELADAHADCMRDFKADYELWLWWVANRPRTGRWATLVDERSVFMMPIVRMLVAACLRSGWKVSEEVSDLAFRLASSFGGSAIIEDCFQRERWSETMDQGNNQMSSERIWLEAIRKKVLADVHKFKEVTYAEGEVFLGLGDPVELPPAAELFRAEKALCSLEKVRDLMPSKSSSAPWPTWSADTLSQQVVDLEKLKHFKRCWSPTKQGGLKEHHLGLLWQSKLMRRGMLVRSRRHCPEWKLVIGQVGADGVALWPIRVWEEPPAPVDPSSPARRLSALLSSVVLPDISDDLEPLVAAPPVVPVLPKPFKFAFVAECEPEDVQVVVVPNFAEWDALPAAVVGEAEPRNIINNGSFHGLGFKIERGPLPLIEAAAWEGFHGMKMTVLNLLLEQLDVPQCDNVFSCVKGLVHACLGEDLPAEDLLDILSQRGETMRSKGVSADHKALLEADDAGVALTQSDQKLFKEMQEKANKVDPELKVFDSCLDGLRSQVRSRLPAGAATPRLNRSAGAAPAPSRSGDRLVRGDHPAPSAFTRTQLRELLPPTFGAGHDSIQKRWRAYSLTFKCPGVSRAWLAHGKDRAAWLVAAEAWKLYRRRTGADIPPEILAFLAS